TMDTLGLDYDIFGIEKRGVGLAPKTPVIVIGTSIAPGDSGAPLVKADDEVVGIVGGGRRELPTQALVGITWATAFGPELSGSLVQPGANVQEKLKLLAGKSMNQFFSTDAFRKMVHGIELVEVEAPGDESGRLHRYWVMATEATKKD